MGSSLLDMDTAKAPLGTPPRHIELGMGSGMRVPMRSSKCHQRALPVATCSPCLLLTEASWVK